MKTNTKMMKTLQDTLDALTTAPLKDTLSGKKAGDMVTAIQTLCHWLQDQPGNVLACELTIDYLVKAARLGGDALGIARRTFTNIIGRVKAAVRLTNKAGSLPSFTRKAQYRPDWRAIADELDTLQSDGKLPPHHRRGIAHILGYANWKGIAPAQFTSVELGELLALHTASGGDGRKAIDGARAWNAIVDLGVTTLFPTHELSWPSRERRINPDWTAYPTALREDLDRYLAWLQQRSAIPVTDGPDIPDWEFQDSDGSDGLEMRERAVGEKHATLVEMVVRQTAGALVRRGTAPAQIQSLADIATVQALRTSLADIRARHEAEGRFNAESGYRYAAGNILWTVARDWVHAPEAVVNRMKADTAKVKPDHLGYMAPSRKRMLVKFDDSNALLAWYDQPAQLVASAERKRRTGRIDQEAINDIQTALLIQMINVLPARPGNLAAQRFRGNPALRNLLLPRTKGGAVFMLWRPSEVKNLEHLKAELDATCVATLRLYLEHYWAAALRFSGQADSDFLFPGHRPGKAKTEEQMNKSFSARMAKAGLDMTLHLGRHLAAKVILDEDPSLIGVASRLLAHKSLETTRKFYAENRTEHASRKYREIIEQKVKKLRGGRSVGQRISWIRKGNAPCLRAA